MRLLSAQLLTLSRSPGMASGLLVTPSGFVSLQISWPASFAIIQVSNEEFKQQWQYPSLGYPLLTCLQILCQWSLFEADFEWSFSFLQKLSVIQIKISSWERTWHGFQQCTIVPNKQKFYFSLHVVKHKDIECNFIFVSFFIVWLISIFILWSDYVI